MITNPQAAPEDKDDREDIQTESIFEYAEGMDLQKLLAIETTVNAIRELHVLGEPIMQRKIENSVEAEDPAHITFLERALEQKRNLDRMN